MASTKQSYRTKLRAVSTLKTQGLEHLHQRVTMLNDVFTDKDFRADTPGDDFALADILDRYVDDTALTFLELRAVLMAFPSAAAWSTKPLRELYAEAKELSRPATPDGDHDAKPPRRRVTAKDFDELSGKLQDATFLNKTLTTEVSELREENRRLVAENAKLEGRLCELERQVERSGASPTLATAR